MQPFIAKRTIESFAESAQRFGEPYCYGHYRPTCSWCQRTCVSAAKCKEFALDPTTQPGARRTPNKRDPGAADSKRGG